MKIGILGGTFDPVHLGHLVFAEMALHQLGLDLVKFVPAGEPWRRTNHFVTEASHRLEMARLAVIDNPHFAVDNREISRPGPTYTADTLREMAATLDAEDELFFLMGEDALADMPNWREPEAITATARLVVAPREDEAPGFLSSLDHHVARIDMPYIGISSTWLRDLAAHGHSLRYLVPTAVAEYIRENQLYRQ